MLHGAYVSYITSELVPLHFSNFNIRFLMGKMTTCFYSTPELSLVFSNFGRGILHKYVNLAFMHGKKRGSLCVQ